MATAFTEGSQSRANITKPTLLISNVGQTDGATAQPTVWTKLRWLQEFLIPLKVPTRAPGHSSRRGVLRRVDNDVPATVLPNDNIESGKASLSTNEVSGASSQSAAANSMTASTSYPEAGQSHLRISNALLTPASSVTPEFPEVTVHHQSSAQAGNLNASVQKNQEVDTTSSEACLRKAVDSSSTRVLDREGVWSLSKIGETSSDAIASQSAVHTQYSAGGKSNKHDEIRPSLCITEIPFDGFRMEKLDKSHYYAKWRDLPEPLVKIWNDEIKSKVNRDLRDIIAYMSGQHNHILSNVQFGMVGERRGNVLQAQPTIVITCATKDCRRKVSRLFTKQNLDYLKDFEGHILVVYQRGPSYWAAGESVEAALDNPNVLAEISMSKKATWRNDLKAMNPSESVHQGDTEVDETVKSFDDCLRFSNLSIEKADSSTSCGLRLRTMYTISSSNNLHCSTLGGILSIDGVHFGMTTAHGFFMDTLSQPVLSDTADATGSSILEPESDSDSNRSVRFQRPTYTFGAASNLEKCAVDDNVGRTRRR